MWSPTAKAVAPPTLAAEPLPAAGRRQAGDRHWQAGATTSSDRHVVRLRRTPRDDKVWYFGLFQQPLWTGDLGLKNFAFYIVVFIFSL